VGLFGSSKEFIPSHPALVVGMDKGKYSRLFEKSDPYIASEIRPGEEVVLYSFGFEAIADEVVVVTNQRILLANGRKIRAIDLESVSETRLLKSPNGTCMVALEPRQGLIQFLSENSAQFVCGAIDANLPS
jgi:hypothetical protein